MHVCHSPGGQKLGFTICRNIKYRKSPLGPHLFKKGFVALTWLLENLNKKKIFKRKKQQQKNLKQQQHLAL